MSNNLTVCICVYNAERLIEETLAALARQSFRDFDLLVVNDCSTDHTVEIVGKFADEHPEMAIKIVALPENGGLAAARHYAEFSVDTEFLCFVDADDIPYPDAIEKMYNRIQEDADCIAVGVHCEYIDVNAKKIGGGIFIGPKSKEEFMSLAGNKKLMFLSPFNISRLEYIRKVGGRAVDGFPTGKPRYQDMCEDLDLWTRMSDFYKEGKYIVAIPEVLLQYRKMVTSMSSDTNAMNMRMRHIKTNLLRRRAGEKELPFVEFIQQITLWQKIKYAYEDVTTGFYKKAGFYYMNKKYFRFMIYFGGCALSNPRYFMQKICRNAVPAVRKNR